jgi:hypothetical protein
MTRSKSFQVLSGSALVLTGFILSPLSWWNDLLVNVPIAYAFSYLFSLVSKSLFLPSFVMGYWITNILGFVLMHKGLVGAKRAICNDCVIGNAKDESRPFWVRYRKDLIVSIAYTLAIVLFGVLGFLDDPVTMFQSFQKLLTA